MLFHPLAKALPEDTELKKLVTQFLSLDIRNLCKRQWLRPHTRYEWVWRDKEGKPASGVAVLALRNTVVLIIEVTGKDL